MNSKIIERIKKLLNLAKSPSEHEAAAAAAMAAALMVDHQISEATFADAEDKSNDPLGRFWLDGFKKRVTWMGDLAMGTATAYGCFVHWSGANLIIVGHDSDVDAIKYTYKYLVSEINRLAEESWNSYYLKEFESARGYKTAFRRGASERVRFRLLTAREEKLAKEKANASDDKCQAIVKVESKDQDVKDFYEDLSKDFGKVKPTNIVASLEGLNAGIKAGNNINLGGNKELEDGKDVLNPHLEELE